MPILRRKTKASGGRVEGTPISSAEEMHETIARRAYELYEMRGAEGDPLTDWLMAEAEIQTLLEARMNQTAKGNGAAARSTRSSAPVKPRKKAASPVTRKISLRPHTMKSDHP